MKFTELGLNEKILEAIGYMGFENATPIQEQAVPIILDNKDLIACAQTGTGKTAAFILPTLHLLSESKTSGTKVVVICPTRELAKQIENQIQGFAYFLGISSIALYGGGTGQEWMQEKKALSEGAEIIVATPGKLIAHLNMNYAKLGNVQHFILDEADRMLDMGFVDDIKKINSYLPKKKQTLMFSATMPPKIRDFAKKLLFKPEQITISLSKPAAGVLQAAFEVSDHQKIELIHRLISDKPNYSSIIIFSSTKKNVSKIVSDLKRKRYNIEGISSDYSQTQREAVLANFRTKKTRIVVATDVLARGIDIKEINLVINFDVPNNAEDYVHRVGRTARADTTGVALTLINRKDSGNFRQIEKLIGSKVNRSPLPKGM